MSLSISAYRGFSGLLNLPPKLEACLDGGRIRMYWWNEVPNLGDTIAPMIVANLSGREVVHAGKRDKFKLLSCGSVISKARNGDIVWGSGSLSPEAHIRGKNVKFLAVRGPLTRKVVLKHGLECPEIYGDPGCLIPRLFPRPENARPTYPLGIIPHYKEKDQVLQEDPSVKIIDIQAEPGEFLRDLWSCERIASSSLHGIIFAEAYGIPAHWLLLTDRLAGGSHKFADYYQGTGRECPEPLSPKDIHLESTWIRPIHNNAPILEAVFPLCRPTSITSMKESQWGA